MRWTRNSSGVSVGIAPLNGRVVARVRAAERREADVRARHGGCDAAGRVVDVERRLDVGVFLDRPVEVSPSTRTMFKLAALMGAQASASCMTTRGPSQAAAGPGVRGDGLVHRERAAIGGAVERHRDENRAAAGNRMRASRTKELHDGAGVVVRVAVDAGRGHRRNGEQRHDADDDDDDHQLDEREAPACGRPPEPRRRDARTPADIHTSPNATDGSAEQAACPLSWLLFLAEWRPLGARSRSWQRSNDFHALQNVRTGAPRERAGRGPLHFQGDSCYHRRREVPRQMPQECLRLGCSSRGSFSLLVSAALASACSKSEDATNERQPPPATPSGGRLFGPRGPLRRRWRSGHGCRQRSLHSASRRRVLPRPAGGAEDIRRAGEALDGRGVHDRVRRGVRGLQALRARSGRRPPLRRRLGCAQQRRGEPVALRDLRRRLRDVHEAGRRRRGSRAGDGQAVGARGGGCDEQQQRVRLARVVPGRAHLRDRGHEDDARADGRSRTRWRLARSRARSARKLPGPTDLPPAAAALPVGVALPARHRVPPEGGARRSRAIGPAAVGYYKDGEKRWRDVAIVRADAEGAKEAFRAFKLKPGACP